VLLLAAVVAAMLLLGACVSDPPVTSVSDEISPETTLVSQRPAYHDKLVVVRFRVTQCGLVVVGSGFAIGPHTILTNRHVVAAAAAGDIQVDTWDGRPLHVVSAKVSPDVDLAEVTVSDTLSDIATLATDDPPGKTPVVAVGYPLAKALRLAPGKTIELLDGDVLDTGFRILLTSASVKPGNSGGPLIDGTGTVVGVVFALTIGDETGLAIPITVVHKTIDDDDFIANYTCGTVPPGVLV
jgi:S1-C subfamily serine protease